MGELLGRWAKVGAAFVVFWLLVFVWNSYGCRKPLGTEMEPTLKKDDLRWFELKVNAPGELSAGDIVMYEVERPSGTNPQSQYAGRVIALPGQRVRIQDGKVFVNDALQDQGFVAGDKQVVETRSEIVVPRDHFYILADNRREYGDADSRGVGPIGRWAIDGRFRR